MIGGVINVPLWIGLGKVHGSVIILAQSSLGVFLTDQRVEADLRNPTDGYAWLVTVGDKKSAARLRGTFDAREAEEADRLASEYSAKYTNPPSVLQRLGLETISKDNG
jgi:hypothetical protein